MSYNYYSYLIMLSDNSDASLEKLKMGIENFYNQDNRVVKISSMENTITLTINGWNLYIGYSNDSHVIIESKEIAERFAKGKPAQTTISLCKARFEMSADPDPDMEFFNDSLYVQEAVEGFKEVFIFDTNDPGFTNI